MVQSLVGGGQQRPSLFFCTETDSQRIASSGVIPEHLLTHDPSRSRFRVYFKRPSLNL